MIESVAVVLVKNGKVLIVQKDAQHKLAGLWEFPGGKIEAGESEEACVKREMIEELGVTVRVVEKWLHYTYPLPHYHLSICVFIAELISGEIQLLEHVNMAWVTPSELHQYVFVPSDMATVRALENNGLSLN